MFSVLNRNKLFFILLVLFLGAFCIVMKVTGLSVFYNCPLFLSKSKTEFVGSLLCSERFFPGYSSFPLSAKNQYDLISFVHDPTSYSALNIIM